MSQQNSRVELNRGDGWIAIFRKLRAAKKKVRAVKLYLCGLEIAPRPLRGSRLLAQITAYVNVRCLVDEEGVAAVFPRPHCELEAEGLLVNGQFCDTKTLLCWLSVWPELDDEIKRRFGEFASPTGGES